jgi:hypothetical protein
LPARFGIDGNAEQRSKQVRDQVILRRPRSVPKFSYGNCQRRDKTTAISPVLLSNKTRHWRGRGTRLYTSF